MDNTILGVIIGGAIASVPAIAAAWFNFVDSNRKRMHEIDMKRIDTYDHDKSDAILDFSRILGDFAAFDFKTATSDAKEKLRREYSASFERLSLYVSEETVSAISNLNMLDNFMYIEPQDREYIAVRNMLRAEMHSLTLTDDAHTQTRWMRFVGFIKRQIRTLYESGDICRPEPDPAGKPVHRHKD